MCVTDYREYMFFGQTKWVFSKVVLGFQNIAYDFLGLGETFEGAFTDTCVGQFPLVSSRVLGVCTEGRESFKTKLF